MLSAVTLGVPWMVAAGKGCGSNGEGEVWRQRQGVPPPGLRPLQRVGVPHRLALSLFRVSELQGQTWCPRDGS